MVRPLQRSILGRWLALALRSISVQRTPRRPRSRASVSPTGPAPTISTWVSTATGRLRQPRKARSQLEGGELGVVGPAPGGGGDGTLQVGDLVGRDDAWLAADL